MTEEKQLRDFFPSVKHEEGRALPSELYLPSETPEKCEEIFRIFRSTISPVIGGTYLVTGNSLFFWYLSQKYRLNVSEDRGTRYEDYRALSAEAGKEILKQIEYDNLLEIESKKIIRFYFFLKGKMYKVSISLVR